MKRIVGLTICVICFTTILFSALIKPIPDEIKVDKKKVQLGKKLFFDPVLSKDGTISCATCHDLQNGGDDGLKFSFGIRGRRGISILLRYIMLFLIFVNSGMVALKT
jgi:cytochrome c peroxidase